MSSLKNFKFQKEDDDQLLEDEEQNVPKLVRERNRDEHMRTILKSIEAGHLFNQSEEEEDPKSDPIITFTNKEREELSIDVQCDDWPVSQSILDFTKPMGAAEENVVIENSQKWEINTEFQIEDNKEVETRHADEESQKDLFEQEAKLNIKFEFVRPLTPPPISNNFVKAPGMASVKSDVSSSKSMCVASTSKKRDKPSYRYAEAPVRKFVRPLTPPPISTNFVKAPRMASVKSDVSSSKSMCVASTSKKRDKPSYRYAEAPV